MRGSIKLFRIFGIDINIHFTFLILLFLVLPGGAREVFLVIAIFFFVTVHELSHSLVAKYFNIPVYEITLLPIGGVSAMSRPPDTPMQEFLISIAGPLSNITVLVVFYLPLKSVLGPEVLFHGLTTKTWEGAFAYAYWINLMLAGFNLLPAFPMDGGRILRSILAGRLGYRKATKIAANLGRIFALVFAFLGITHFNIILILIAVFIYMAASSEEFQVEVKETLKKFKVRDILPRDFSVTEAEDVEDAEYSVIETPGGAMNRILIAPSILSADFSKLGQEVRDVEKAGADWIHVDVMDGHFVPNITMGPAVVRSIRPITRLPLDVHLMIKDPEKYIESFAKAGADIITFHIEVEEDHREIVKLIRYFKKKVGLSIRPKTPVETLEPILPMVDLVLVMTVEPGFGGQVFMADCAPKVEEVRKVFKKDIEVDGGINEATVRDVIAKGANVIVAGTSVFGTKNYAEAIRRLRG